MKLLTLFLFVFGSVYGEMAIPENAGDSLRTLIVSNGPDALIEYIEKFDPPQRLQLYQLAREVIVFSYGKVRIWMILQRSLELESQKQWGRLTMRLIPLLL